MYFRFERSGNIQNFIFLAGTKSSMPFHSIIREDINQLLFIEIDNGDSKRNIE
jgi:hypothetical protein